MLSRLIRVGRRIATRLKEGLLFRQAEERHVEPARRPERDKVREPIYRSVMSPGTLIDRSVFAAVHVESGDSIQFSYDLMFTADRPLTVRPREMGVSGGDIHMVPGDSLSVSLSPEMVEARSYLERVFRQEEVVEPYDPDAIDDQEPLED